MTVKIGDICVQVKAIEEFGFDFVGMEFEIQDVTDIAVRGVNQNLRLKFGIEKDKFDEYFEVLPKFVADETVEDDMNCATCPQRHECYAEVEDELELEDDDEEYTLEDFLSDMFDDGDCCCEDDDDEIEVEVVAVKPKNTVETYTVQFTNNAKVIRNGLATVVILGNGIKGISKCMPDDEYDARKGLDIAFIKAMIKSLNKDLKQLTK